MKTARGGSICLAQGMQQGSLPSITHTDHPFLSCSYLEAKNLPETYYCIECLLRLTGNGTDARLKNVGFFLPGIALMRRALWVGYTEGEIKGEQPFSKRLGESKSADMCRL